MSFDSKAKTEAALIRHMPTATGTRTTRSRAGAPWGKLMRVLDNELAVERKQRQELAAGKRKAVRTDMDRRRGRGPAEHDLRSLQRVGSKDGRGRGQTGAGTHPCRHIAGGSY